MEPAGDDRPRTHLSTGHTVALPLDLECTMGGVTVPARRNRLEDAVPTALSPLAIAPGVGCVALVGIQYHRVGGDGGKAGRPNRGLDPYDEFAVVVPAVRGGRTNVPFAQLLGGNVGGYVHWLPVTTDASVALGREVWGYPKEHADVTVTDGPRGLRTVVSDGDGERVRLGVPRRVRPRIGGRKPDWALPAYSTKDGALLRTRARIQGQIGIGAPVGTTLSVGADLAGELGLWQRPLACFYGTRVRVRVAAGEPVDHVAVEDG